MPRVAGVIAAAVFDVGECLVVETREYGKWADRLGVPRHVFSAVFGAVIDRKCAGKTPDSWLFAAPGGGRWELTRRWYSGCSGMPTAAMTIDLYGTWWTHLWQVAQAVEDEPAGDENAW